ncbi:MAG: hypothetical protein SP1CHLAM42_15190 [Chlamydiales bacterium]|nr:hypothetical protein [Chlamydiales bacterium]
MSIEIGLWRTNVCVECHENQGFQCPRCDLPRHAGCAFNHDEVCSQQASSVNLLGKIHRKAESEGTACDIMAIAKEVLPTVMPTEGKRVIDASGKQYSFEEWRATLQEGEPWESFAVRVKSILDNVSPVHLLCSVPLIADVRHCALLPLYKVSDSS